MAPLSPMLAMVYDRAAAAFPAAVQPKLDGVRAVASAVPGSGVVRLASRNGKPFDHLLPVLGFGPPAPRRGAPKAGARKDKQPPGPPLVAAELDGELYVHGVGFQQLISDVRQGRAGLEYHVYDAFVPSRPDAPLAERLAVVRAWVAALGGAARSVETGEVRDAGAVDAQLARRLGEGYEGIMLRDPAAPYGAGKRSPALRKLKPFEDAEFEIVGWDEAKGKDRGTVVFRCRGDNKSLEFSARPTGTLEHRAQLLRDAPSLVGRMLTVRYQGLTDAGLPRFPIAVAVRDDLFSQQPFLSGARAGQARP